MLKPIQLKTDDRQEAFDLAYNGVLKQGKKSVGGEGGPSCAYRGMDGCACGVGHLIADEDYDPEIEYELVEGLIGRRKIDTHLSAPFLRDLQAAHDHLSAQSPPKVFAEKFKKQMAKVAEVWELEVRPYTPGGPADLITTGVPA